MYFINWIKTHKLVVILLLIIAFLYFKNNTVIPLFPNRAEVGYQTSEPSLRVGAPDSMQQSMGVFEDSSNRIVTKTSDLSLLVTDVRNTGDKIIAYANNLGGFMVFASYNRPTESPFATITVRIPTIKLDEALKYIRSLSIKVTSENLVGEDITDQYIDIESRVATLKKTQAKFEDILEKATTVTDILAVQRELISLQEQIDSLIGQKGAIEKNAALTKITAYLSTDELALPYVPDKAFRPNIIFKLAVRSLFDTLRNGAEAAIWIGVYSLTLIPIALGVVIYKKLKKKV